MQLPEYEVNTENDEIPTSQGKHWIVVINNPEPVDQASFLVHQEKFEYYIIGEEVGKKGTPHLQCYVVFAKKVKFSVVKKCFPRCWCQLKSKFATPEQASKYCEKEGNFKSFGTLPKAQGVAGGERRAEMWGDAKALARADKLDDISPEIYVKHYSTLKRIRSDARNKVMKKTLNWTKSPNKWYYGPTGTGIIFSSTWESLKRSY